MAEIRRTGVRVYGSAALSEPARDARTLTAQLARVVSEARHYVSGPLRFAHLSEAYDQLLWGAEEDRVREEIEHLSVALEGAQAEVHARHRTAPRIAALGPARVTVHAVGEELRELCRVAADRGMITRLPHVEHSKPMSAPSRTTSHSKPPHG